MVSPLGSRETIRLWEFIRKTFKMNMKKVKEKREITAKIRRRENILQRRIRGQRTFDKKVNRLTPEQAEKEYNQLRSFRTKAWRRTDLWAQVKDGFKRTYRKIYGDRETEILKENLDNRDNEYIMWKVYDETGMMRSKSSIASKKWRLRK